MGLHIALKAGEGARVADAGPSVVREQRPHRLIGPGCPRRRPGAAASSTVPPYRSNCQAVRGLKPTAASMAVSAVVE